MSSERQQDGGGAAVAAGRRTEVAVLAGGCFWGVEEILRAVPGVLDAWWNTIRRK